MKKILITGITGFAGSHLAEYLLSQNENEIVGVHSSDRNINNIEGFKDKIHLIKIDLNNTEDTARIVSEQKPEVIFHLAASADVGKSFKDPLGFLNNNTNSQLNILEAVKKAGLETKIIVISSAQVYGYISADNIPTNEKTPLKPDSPYSVSKITQEYLALQYYYTYKLPVVILRPFNHLGPRLAPVFAISRFAKLIAEIEKGKSEPVLTVGNLSAKRDFTDVRDMAKAYALSADKCALGEVYNIGTGVSFTIAELLDKLLSLSKTKIEIKTDQSLLRPSDNPELRADASKFMTETDWKPEISTDQTLKDVLDYWRDIV